MNHQLLMENWRRYLNELNLDPTMGTTDTANVVYTSRALSNQQKQKYNKAQRELAKGNIPPETIKKVKNAVKQAWQNFGYNKFAALWNSTLGYILPELPRTDQGSASFGLDIAFLVFEIVGYVFGYTYLMKGYKILKKALTPILKVVTKIPGVEKLKNMSAEKASEAYGIIKNKFASAAQKIKSGGPKLVDSINSNFERGMLNVLGAV